MFDIRSNVFLTTNQNILFPSNFVSFPGVVCHYATHMSDILASLIIRYDSLTL